MGKKRNKKKSEGPVMIKAEIKRAFIIILSLALGILGAATCSLNYVTLQKAMKDSMMATAQVAADQINYSLKSTMNAVEVIGSIAWLSDSENTAAEKRIVLDDYVKQYGWISLNLTDTSGKGITNTELDVSDRDYFKRALEGETVFSDPVYSKETGELIMVAAAPLWQDGKIDTSVAGVVVASVDAKQLSEVVANIHISDNGGVYMINSEGTEIADQVFENVEAQWNTCAEAEKDSKLKALAKLERKMIEGEQGFGSYFYSGKFKYMGYAPIGINGWSVAITAPIGDFLGGTTFSIIMTILLLAVFMVAGIRYAQRFGSRIGDAVQICADRLKLLAEGDLTTEVQVLDSKDETKILEESTRAIVQSQQTIIGDVSYLLNEMAIGNFDVKSKIGEAAYVGAYYELLAAMRVMKKDLSDMLRMIIESSAQVDAGASQLAEASQSLAEGAMDQSGAVQELLAMVSGVTEQAEHNNDATAAASDKIKSIGEAAVQCEEMMQELTKDMQNIERTSSEVNNIINEIEEIASQTNLLSLNASIEAARAGEAGRGFAVVASQIGALAEQSAASAVNTKHLIEATLAEIAKGGEATNSTADRIEHVMRQVEEVVKLIENVQKASASQTEAVEQICLGVEQISSVVESNSAAAQESSATSEELSAQADSMENVVSRFKLEQKA